MNSPSKDLPFENEELNVRRPYQKPKIKRVDLALAETLSQGCKLDVDSACVGPPITAYDGGS